MEGAEASYTSLGADTPAFLPTKAGRRRKVWAYQEDEAMEMLTLEVIAAPPSLPSGHHI